MTTNQEKILPESISRDPQKARKLLESISEIVKAVNKNGLKFTKRLDHILEVIMNYLGVDQGSIMVLERKKLTVKAATRKDLVGKQQKLDKESVASWVARHKTHIFIPDISKDDRFHRREGDAYRKNGLLSVPIVQNNKVIGVVNVTDKAGDKNLLKEDITYLLNFSSLILSTLVQQQLQEKLKRQKKTLRRRNKELRRQEKLRDELSRMLIHDLKAPLSEVIANLDILSYTITGEEKEFIESAQVSCDRTVRMVSNLVSVNQIEDGRIKLYKEEVELHDLVNESLSAIKGIATIKNVNLTLELPDGPLPTLHIDRILILRVIQNLLINALGHSMHGTEIYLGCSMASKKMLEIYVQDCGDGIAPQEQATIFEKYSRLSSKQDSLVGSGLGLYFCKLAVEIHKGTIGVSSTPGEGSRFFFTLPL